MVQKAVAAWVRLACRFAPAVLLVASLATGGALAYTLSHFRINTSTTDMLAEHLPFRQNLKALQAAFPQLNDALSVVVEADSAEGAEAAAAELAMALASRPDRFRLVFYGGGHPFFRRNGLLYLDPDELATLADRLAEAQPLLAWLNQDPSLRGLAGALELALENDATSPALGATLEAMAATAEQVALGRPGRLSWLELIAGGPPKVEHRRKFILLQPVLDHESLEPGGRALDQVRRMARDLGLGPDNGITLRILGEPAMLHDELKSLSQGMGKVALLSLTLVIALLVLGLRSWRLILATLAALFTGLIWTAFFAIAVLGELNLLSVAFAVLFIGLSVDFGIHFALRTREAVDQGAETVPALIEAAGGAGGALALSALAAAIGFFSFLPTAYRGVSELGLISGTGMFIALIANLTVLPAILTLLPLNPSSRAAGIGIGARSQSFIERRHRPILAGVLVLAVASLIAGSQAWFDDDPLNLRDPESVSVASLLDLLDDPRVEPYEVTVLAGDLDQAARLADALRALPEVAEASTLLDLVPEQQDAKLAVIEDMTYFLASLASPLAKAAPSDAAARRQAIARLISLLGSTPGGPAAERLARALGRLGDTDRNLRALEEALLADLPARLAALAEALGAKPVALPDLPAALRARMVAADGRALVRVTPAEDLRDQAARRRFVTAVQTLAPSAAGAPITITEAGTAVVGAFVQAAVTALSMIVLLLLIVLRSLRDCALVLTPLALAALLTVAATVVLSQPFNFANVIVLPLLFGLGVASGIHIVSRGRNAPGGILRTSTPRAVVFSALTTIASFGALALSGHRGTASMGLLLTIAITLTMASTLIVLPALLAAFPGAAGRRS
jgi:hopanoid biosynthesis associated RND transporter like protein HpnN